MPVRRVLVGDQLHAENLAGVLAYFFDRLGDLDATALSAPAGVNLRLDDPDLAAQRFRRLDRLIDALTEESARNNHSELFEKFFSLIFVNIHLPSLLGCK